MSRELPQLGIERAPLRPRPSVRDAREQVRKLRERLVKQFHSSEYSACPICAEAEAMSIVRIDASESWDGYPELSWEMRCAYCCVTVEHSLRFES